MKIIIYILWYLTENSLSKHMLQKKMFDLYFLYIIAFLVMIFAVISENNYICKSYPAAHPIKCYTKS